jgi:tetratricopeptide (TPR) repeat protein
MKSKIAFTLVVLALSFQPPNSVQAFQTGGVPGGPGFTGAAGGGFTGPRGGGFTDSLSPTVGTDNGVGLNLLQLYRMRRTGTPQLSTNANRNAIPSKPATNRGRSNRVDNTNVNRLGIGWNNPFKRYHATWIHGYWTGQYPGGFGWRSFGSGVPSSQGARSGGEPGIGLGWGLSSWLFGPMLYTYGYFPYANPYDRASKVASRRPAARDYSQPIDPQSAPPPNPVTDLAAATFETAREAFKRGDHSRALELIDQVLKEMPDDPALHEFRALALFALTRCDEAAAALYAVLAVQPGCDWTTLISLYADPGRYTQQLRTFEAISARFPQSASVHFVLAYHYLTQEFAEAAVAQYKSATALEPRDALSSQLILQLEHPRPQVTTSGPTQSSSSTATAAAVQQNLVNMIPAGKEGKIAGNWTAQPGDDRTISVVFHYGGRFTWKVSRQGKEQQFEGNTRYENGMLAFVQDQNNSTMVGNVRWVDESHFVFTVMGAGPEDKGLSFTNKT